MLKFLPYLILILFSFKPGLGQNTLPDLQYLNFLGGETNISDFKGKVVYVEIWASWCHFCKKEMPAAKKLHRLFKKEKDIVFLNIAIDEKELGWRDAIAKKKFGGVNLITFKGFDSEIIKHFDIKGIPHFIMVDKKGNIVNDNAKRPSDPLIIQDLEKLLE
ncbi:TlpA family protein disulfide reductase [Cytophagaceae bacterium AH-315-L13]|nr:TlpA family protein disulfide reductase [Cytophagaceae bacterium AH-315-L13]